MQGIASRSSELMKQMCGGRSGACDGALCIAVLHHMSSEARRVRTLSELGRVLRCGGVALVTVWASEQEDPTKLAKWEPLSRQCATATLDPAEDMQDAAADLHRDHRPGASSQMPPNSSRSAAQPELLTDCNALPTPEASRVHQAQGADYLVPWHIPFHRANAAGALRATRGQHRPAGTGVASHGVINQAKGTVVFKRYYHLFNEEELKELVGHVPELTLQHSFYDKSNWCVIVERT